MKLVLKLFSLFLFIISFTNVHAQTDATNILKIDDFQSLVIKHHPISKKIALKTEMANMYLMKAKGNFDPKVIGTIYQKYLNDQADYSIVETQIKSTTRSPISLVGGYDLNSGLALNPQNETGLNGLSYAGISFSLLQGLLTDPSRTELRKSALFQELTVFEQQILMNDLLYYSGKTYWDWFVAYQTQLLYQEAAELALQRLSFVKQSSELGDRPFLDTLEASIFYTSIDLLFQQSKLEYENATLSLSLFLWDENLTPLQLKETILPPTLDQIDLNDSVLKLVGTLKDKLNQHPEIRRYNNYLDNLLLDERLYKEQLKPVLDLKYNFITKSLNSDPILSTNNYTWGLNFQMPVFLRKERANLKLINLKKQENEFDLQYKIQSVNVEFEKALNKWELSTTQLSQWEKMVENYLLLANGESELFQSGESSIFLMNTRQVNYLNAKMKFLELIYKNNESLLATFRSAGALTK